MVNFQTLQEDTFTGLIEEFNSKKCCIVDTASTVSGVAKFTMRTLLHRGFAVNIDIFIWFVVTLFIQILKGEFEEHGNKIFICVIRECSIIPQDVFKELGFPNTTIYICKILHKMRVRIQEGLGEECVFMILGADTNCQDTNIRKEVDDALCILLSSQVENSHILTCDGYNSFRKKKEDGTVSSVTFEDIAIMKCRSGAKFKTMLSLTDVRVESRKCHVHRARMFRQGIETLCSSTDFRSLHQTYLALQVG